MDADKIRSGATTRDLTSRFIAYILGENLDNDEKDNLLDKIKQQFPSKDRGEVKLPKQI